MTTEPPEEFTQWLNTKKIYLVDFEHLDGSHLSVISKPTWSMVHKHADGSPAQAIGVLETSPDGCTGRITTEHLAGSIEVTVIAPVSPSAVASRTFTINVLAHPPVTARSPTFRISQHRNGPIH